MYLYHEVINFAEKIRNIFESMAEVNEPNIFIVKKYSGCANIFGKTIFHLDNFKMMGRVQCEDLIGPPAYSLHH
jgi:hypothetical protein